MSSQLSDIVSQFNRLLSSSGGRLTLVRVSGSEARLIYHKGSDDSCKSCVLDADDLRTMLLESFQRHDCGISSVHIESVPTPMV